MDRNIYHPVLFKKGSKNTSFDSAYKVGTMRAYLGKRLGGDIPPISESSNSGSAVVESQPNLISRSSTATPEPLLNDSGLSTSSNYSSEVESLKQELLLEKQSKKDLEASIVSRDLEIEDLRIKLEHAVRGRPSSGDLSSSSVLELLKQELKGCSIVNAAKLQSLLSNSCLCEDVESLTKEAAAGEKSIVDLYNSI